MYWYNNGFHENKVDESAIELSQEEYDSLMENLGDGGILKEDTNGKPYVEVNETVVNNRIENLRIRRENECFSVINRGVLWYNTLTETQRLELDVWYKAWLNVTDTFIVPEKPSWLN